jgi:putative DNA primase/helicase
MKNHERGPTINRAALFPLRGRGAGARGDGLQTDCRIGFDSRPPAIWDVLVRPSFTTMEPRRASGGRGTWAMMTYALTPHTIVAVMGGEVTGRNSCNVPGPNHSPKDRSLSILIASGRLIVYSHAGDDWRVCRNYANSKLGFADECNPDNAPSVMTGDDQERRKKIALQIWADCIDPRGTLAEYYLREHRGLNLPDDITYSVIRFHAGLRCDVGKYLPGMVCLLRNINSNEPCGVHRTFLDRFSGKKSDRKMLGVAKGAAIKLDAAPSSTLTVGEGVETVLAARAAGFTPAWALGSSGAVRAFPVLPNLRELTILQEDDPTSSRDVKTCSRRYLGVGRPVNIVEPNIGNDFNDCWKARADE